MIIDVSEHNGTLDWEKIRPQIEAAILRCGYGIDAKNQDDKKWLRNLSECERLKIPIGVYLYSYANNETNARSEAQHVARLIKGHELQLPVFYDLEERGRGNAARKNYYAFEAELKNASNCEIGLYTGEAYYNQFMQGTATDWRWIAKYGSNDGKAHSKPSLGDKKTVHIWQYTSKGMTGRMDCSQVLDQSIMQIGQQKEVIPTSTSTTGYQVDQYMLHDVKYGSEGEEVKFIQQMLSAVGLYKGAVDGKAGEKTIRAIADFQVHEHTTTAGKGTWQRLIKAVS